MHWTQDPKNKARLKAMRRKQFRKTKGERTVGKALNQHVRQTNDPRELIKRLKAKRDAITVAIGVLQEETRHAS